MAYDPFEEFREWERVLKEAAAPFLEWQLTIEEQTASMRQALDAAALTHQQIEALMPAHQPPPGSSRPWLPNLT